MNVSSTQFHPHMKHWCTAVDKSNPLSRDYSQPELDNISGSSIYTPLHSLKE